MNRHDFSRRDFLRTVAGGAAASLVLPASACRAVAAGGSPIPGAAPGGWEELPALLARIRPPAFPARRVVVTELGALGDGATDARPAIQRAIDSCNQAGGGRVVLPSGIWWSEGPVHLKSNVELHLEEGATLRFTPDPRRYLPLVLSRWEGTELYNYSPQIYAYEATNVAVTGAGVVDGNTKTSFATWKPRQDSDQDRLRAMGAAGVPVHERVFGEGHWLRPPMIQFFGCRNVLVEGLTIRDAAFWVVHPVFCQNVIARDLHIESRNPNNDGVDPDSSVDVLIERCTFDTGDDSVAIKSGRDQDAWRVGQATENVVIRGCRMNSKANGLAIGSEMSAGVRNVFMEDCRIGKVDSSIYFKANLDRGGIVEHVRVRNITAEETATFIDFTTDYHGYRGGHFPPTFRDFVIENVSCERAGTGIHAVGVADSPLHDVVLRDVTVAHAERPVEIRFVEDFVMENVRINGETVRTPPRA